MNRNSSRTTFYSSLPASGQMKTIIAAVESDFGRIVRVRPLSELPAPDVRRSQRLVRERKELLWKIDKAEAVLAAFAVGKLQPDAGRENGVQFALQAMKNRLVGIETVLGTQKGGVDNA